MPSDSAVKPGIVAATTTWQPAPFSAPICGATFWFVTTYVCALATPLSPSVILTPASSSAPKSSPCPKKQTFLPAKFCLMYEPRILPSTV